MAVTAAVEILFLAGFLTRLGLMAPKPPTLEVVVLDSRTAERVTAASVKVERLTARERRGENFIFSVTVMAEGYNTAKEMVALPYEAAGKVVSVTQRLEPLVAVPKESEPPAAVEEPAEVKVEAQPAAPTAVPAVRDVRGVVRRSDGSPLPGARVRLVSVEDGSVKAETRSGADGSYVFRDVEAGAWRVEALAGKETTARRFVLEPSEVEDPRPVKGGAEPKAAVWRVVSARDGRVVLGSEEMGDAVGVVVGVRAAGRLWNVGPDGAVSANRSAERAWRDRAVVLEEAVLARAVGRQVLRPGRRVQVEVCSVWSNGTVHPVPQVLSFVMEDTVPPAPPILEGFAVRGDMAEAVVRRTGPEEPLAYRLYVLDGDGGALLVHATPVMRRDEVTRVSFGWPASLRGRSEVVVAVTAVDTAGNESEFETAGVVVGEGEGMSWDVLLERKGGPVAVSKRSDATEKAKGRRRSKPGVWERFLAGGRIVEGRHTVLSLPPREVGMGAGARVVVRDGGRLTVEGCSFFSDGGGRWGGFVVESGGVLVMRRCRLEDVDTAFKVASGGSLVLEDCEVAFSGTALRASDGWLELRSVRIRRCGTSMDVLGGGVTVSGTEFVSNHQAPRMVAGRVRMEGCRVVGNGSPMVLVGGEAVLERTVVAGGRSDGMRVESARAGFRRCVFADNGGHGVVVRPVGVEDSLFEACDFVGNRLYGVIGGGRLVGCFVARNNGAWGVDTTPDRGSADGIRDAFSNTSVMQIHGVDMIRGLSVERNTEEGR